MPKDFFQPISARQKSVSSDQEPLKASVPGLEIIKDFVDTAEQAQLLSFLDSPACCTWRHDLSRRSMHFGGTYCIYNRDPTAKPEIRQAPPMPPAFDWLFARMVDRGIFKPEALPTYCIVNEYREDQGISAHTENFSFDEPVVGLSLLARCPMRFREMETRYDGSVRSGKAGKAPRTGQVMDVELPARSLVVMRGESRWSWQHEIIRSRKGRGVGWRRVSLTFRVKIDGAIER